MSSRQNLPYYSIRSGQNPAEFAQSYVSGPTQLAARTVSDRPTDSLLERGVLEYSNRLSGSRVMLAH
jgi:hypothetical protein